jgi:hypothetical protein
MIVRLFFFAAYRLAVKAGPSSLIPGRHPRGGPLLSLSNEKKTLRKSGSVPKCHGSGTLLTCKIETKDNILYDEFTHNRYENN